MTEFDRAITTYSFEFLTGLKTFYAFKNERQRRPKNTYYIPDGKIEDLPEIQACFLGMKNEGWTWEMIAEATSTKRIIVSPPLVRNVALGMSQSPKVMMALGIVEEEITVPLSMVRKYPPRANPRKRCRITIESTPEQRRRLDNKRGNLSRGEYLEVLLDAADGIGELP